MEPPLCIIPARMSSTRLPGKPLRTIKGVPLIEIAVRNAWKAFGPWGVVVAIPDSAENNELDDFLWNMGAITYQHDGEEADVLGRFYACAKAHREDPKTVIHRWTPDDHRKDPEMCKRVVAGEKGIPVEIGGECFTLAQLRLANKKISDPFKREHIYHAFHSEPPTPAPEGLYTIDTEEDLARANA